MRIAVLDCEVFKHDWLVVSKDTTTKQYEVFHNDAVGLRAYMKQPDILFATFNGKGYDQFIVKAILAGADNEMVKHINDFIIGGRVGWEHYFIKRHRAYFPFFDLMDDMQMGLSLKAIEGHLGLNIQETSVSFDIDRPLTDAELQEVIAYCKHDVDTTDRLLRLRKDYLEAKMALGRMRDISDTTSLYATNAKITAMFLGAKKREWDDEKEYCYPSNLKLETIPEPLISFFERLCKSGEFNEKQEIEIAPEVLVTYGSGGVHQGLKNYVEVSEE